MAKADQLKRSLRLDELLEGSKHRRKTITSPEGVPLTVQVATSGERIAAFTLDMLFMGLAVVVIVVLMAMLFFSSSRVSVGMTLMLFISFLIRNMYFLHFELAWQGRTPGKRLCGLRVINRQGGELTPSAVIARNLTREVEFFLPMSLLLSTAVSASPLQHMALVGWVMIIALLPLFNKDRLRAGDMIGGTLVIAMPKRLLLPDLTMHRPVVRLAGGAAGGIRQNASLAVPAQPGAATAGLPNASQNAVTGFAGGGQTTAGPTATVTGTAPQPAQQSTPRQAVPYSFTHEQLSVYGAFELQVLEDFLRKPSSQNTQKELVTICGKIMRKIGWNVPVPQNDVRRFLNDFYAAQRAELERAQLFGNLREDKNAAQANKK